MTPEYRPTGKIPHILDAVGILLDINWLVTLDITQLYTNVSNTAGLYVAKEALGGFRTNSKVKPSNDSLVQLMEFVLTKNIFQFNDNHYLHVSSMSIGITMVPAHTNVL